MPNSSLLNNNLLCTPVSARNCWMKAMAVSVIGQKPQCCWGIYSMYEWIPWNFFSNHLDARFWRGGRGAFRVFYKGYSWPQAHFPCRQQIWEQNKMPNQKFFSGTVKGPRAGGYLESQYVANSLFGSSTNGWAHQLGYPQLSCRAFCVKQQHLDLEFTAFEVIIKTVQGGVGTL